MQTKDMKKSSIYLQTGIQAFFMHLIVSILTVGVAFHNHHSKLLSFRAKHLSATLSNLYTAAYRLVLCSKILTCCHSRVLVRLMLCRHLKVFRNVSCDFRFFEWNNCIVYICNSTSIWWHLKEVQTENQTNIWYVTNQIKSNIFIISEHVQI